MDTERRGRVSNEMGGGEGCSTSPGEKETLPGKGKLGQEPSGPAGTLPPHRDPGRPSQLKCVHLIPRASTAVEGNQDHFRPSLSADRGLGLHSSPLLAIVAPHGSRHFWEGGSFPSRAYFRPRLQLVLQPWGWNFRSSPAPSAVLFRVMAAGCPGCSPGKSFFSHSSSAFPGSLGERVPWDCWCPRGSSAFLICTQPRTVGVTPWSWEFGAGRGGLARAPGSGCARVWVRQGPAGSEEAGGGGVDVCPRSTVAPTAAGARSGSGHVGGGVSFRQAWGCPWGAPHASTSPSPFQHTKPWGPPGCQLLFCPLILCSLFSQAGSGPTK